MKHISLLFLFLCFSMYSKSNTTIVYIDISKKTNKEDIIKQTKQIINKNSNDNFIVFISNDNAPIIITNIEYLDKELKKLYYISPSSPSINDETDTLNYYIDNIGLNVNATTNMAFYFFTEPTNKTKRLITKVLLSNRLSNNEGLKNNITVNVLFEKRKETNEIKKNYELYKQKKYEIKFY